MRCDVDSLTSLYSDRDGRYVPNTIYIPWLITAIIAKRTDCGWLSRRLEHGQRRTSLDRLERRRCNSMLPLAARQPL